MISVEQQTAIHHAACEILAAAAHGRAVNRDVTETADLTDVDDVSGVFVTVRRDGKLRACYGTYGGTLELLQALQSAALGAATKDPRFPILSPPELPDLRVEISLLHTIEPLSGNPQQRVAEVVIGKHGLTIRQRARCGLLLPQVAVDLGLDAAGFLRQVCLKAKLAADAWMCADAEMHRFQTNCFGGPFVGAST